MKTDMFLKMTASAMLLGTVAIGCTPGGSHPASLSQSTPRADRQAAKMAGKSAAALTAKKTDAAVRYAEQAVTLAPRNADYRAKLGQAYLMAGRFTSARTSFADALAIDPALPRAKMSFALSQIALGEWDAARATLERAKGSVPESDRGLALALAGDKDGGVRALEAAARTAGAGAKARQNLALGYALAGRWADSQSTAAQDVAPADLVTRMREWALLAQPKTAWDQVATLLGVTPVEDPGQPVALALAPAAAASATQVAVVEPLAEPAAVTATARSEEIVTAQPATELAPMTQPAPAESAVATQDIPAFVAPVATARTIPTLIAAPRHAPATRVARQQSGGRFVIQLGAFSSAGRIEPAWGKAVGRLGTLTAYAPSSATFGARGGMIHRLALSGFATRASANGLCGQIKARGGQCFVREAAGEQPVRWAARGGFTRYAAR